MATYGYNEQRRTARASPARSTRQRPDASSDRTAARRADLPGRRGVLARARGGRAAREGAAGPGQRRGAAPPRAPARPTSA
ncbi:MAG: hypothetical protein MZW92_58220 [Comamonadaceae bacterium]|nr:hypothetical protein [Comamonadaceae bacterium]